MLQRKGAPGIPDTEPVTVRQIPRRLHQSLIHLLTDEALLFRMFHMQERIQHFHIPQITTFQFYKRRIHKRTVYIALRIPDRRYRPHGISLLIIYMYHNTPFPLDMASVWRIKKETAYQMAVSFYFRLQIFTVRFNHLAVPVCGVLKDPLLSGVIHID